MKQFFSLLLSAGVIGLFSFSAKSGQAVDLQGLHIVTEIFPPYQYVRADSRVGGLATEKVNRLLASLGVELAIDVMPWARAYKVAQSKKNTLIYSMVRTPQREQKFHWIGVLLKNPAYYFITLAGRRDIKIAALADLQHYQVGVTRGDVIHQHLLKHNVAEQVVFLPENETTIKMLLKKRVDIVAASPVQLAYVCEKVRCQLSDFRNLYKISGLSEDLYLAANLDTSLDIVTLLRRQLQQLNAQMSKE
ncbi:substrate-binding periplasmic protein [Thalassomonas haliotis]|uniref:Transporter substrate-binding domain-containing protein n=1 Tax=Thalassomonas haliotis TaxID=485448 RepID=A0ABY7V8V5_9GAMM|nr:transporter substrate-binding domain-containing protein [Thalassomonas haliotis]WDE09772.1 transporter substrate-binding domain-containing protein [Thalassomonas haliotis]